MKTIIKTHCLVEKITVDYADKNGDVTVMQIYGYEYDGDKITQVHLRDDYRQALRDVNSFTPDELTAYIRNLQHIKDKIEEYNEKNETKDSTAPTQNCPCC